MTGYEISYPKKSFEKSALLGGGRLFTLAKKIPDNLHTARKDTLRYAPSGKTYLARDFGATHSLNLLSRLEN